MCKLDTCNYAIRAFSDKVPTKAIVLQMILTHPEGDPCLIQETFDTPLTPEAQDFIAKARKYSGNKLSDIGKTPYGKSKADTYPDEDNEGVPYFHVADSWFHDVNGRKVQVQFYHT